MKMEDLNKTQLVLLALLVSFVTSIATGIVTVTLMDQAPPAVTQTINRVIKTTERIIVPQKESQQTLVQNTTVVVKEEDFIIDAAEKNSSNVVRIGYPAKKGFSLTSFKDDEAEPAGIDFVSTGFVIRKDGIVATDASLIDAEREQAIVETLDGTLFDAVFLPKQSTDTIALFAIENVDSQKEETSTIASEDALPFAAISFALGESVRIGQTAIVLGADDGLLLLLGVVSRVEKDVSVSEETAPSEEYTITVIRTTAETDMRYSGGPLLNTDGEVLGIHITAEDGSRFTVPASVIKGLLLLENNTESTEVLDEN